MARLNNGKLLDGRTYSGAEIMKDVPEGRRVVEVNGKCVKNLDPRKNYGPEDIRRKIRVMPQRIKGGEFFPNPRPYPRWPQPIEEKSTLEIVLILLWRIIRGGA